MDLFAVIMEEKSQIWVAVPDRAQFTGVVLGLDEAMIVGLDEAKIDGADEATTVGLDEAISDGAGEASTVGLPVTFFDGLDVAVTEGAEEARTVGLEVINTDGAGVSTTGEVGASTRGEPEVSIVTDSSERGPEAHTYSVASPELEATNFFTALVAITYYISKIELG